MSTARCSSCHCYSRGCPEGLPNHKDSPVGSNCSMNAKGRHFRDPADTVNPSCDYESKGQKCDFFSSGHEHTKLPYPPDISLGPVLSESNNGNTDMSQILMLLQQQDGKFSQLQEQINALKQPEHSAPPVPVDPQPPVPVAPAPPGPPGASIVSAPHIVSNAAATLNSHLNTGLGHNHNMGYHALTMDQLRSNPHLLSEANNLLNVNTQEVPPLNPLTGMGAALGAIGVRPNNVSTVDQLYAATMRNKQLKAYEFAATGQFCYKSQLRQDNTNAITFAFGSFKHLEAAKLGLINMPDDEFLARLRHLKNTFEVACLSSNLTSFTDHAWQVAREYDTRVVADIESGAKTWATLSNGLETDAIYCANQIVELKNKAKKVPKDPKDLKKDPPKKDAKSKVCTTYNTHRASDGCVWEQNNKGESCVFKHYCSWCKLNREVEEKHKVHQCDHKTAE